MLAKTLVLLPTIAVVTKSDSYEEGDVEGCGTGGVVRSAASDIAPEEEEGGGEGIAGGGGVGNGGRLALSW